MSGHDDFESIIDLIASLSLTERRVLFRRLRVSGLVPVDEELTDRDRLQTAVSVRTVSAKSASHTLPVVPQEAVSTLQPGTGSASSAVNEGYRSPVRGKVVVGAPNRSVVEDTTEMAPLPGQAPEQPISVIFDGGSRGNPGQGYGSYALRWPGQQQQVVQLRFGDRVSNNEAEYDTLIAALEAIAQRLKDQGAAVRTARVEIRGDSLLVVNQVNGTYQTKEPRLQVRRDRVRELMRQFGHVDLRHHAREQSVKTLGH